MACLPPAADAPHPLGLLRARGERPSSHRSAEQRDEVASVQLIELHSIPARAELQDIESARDSQEVLVLSRLQSRLRTHLPFLCDTLGLLGKAHMSPLTRGSVRLEQTGRTPMTMRPDPTFHAPPKLAMEAPPENSALETRRPRDVTPSLDAYLRGHPRGGDGRLRQELAVRIVRAIASPLGPSHSATSQRRAITGIARGKHCFTRACAAPNYPAMLSRSLPAGFIAPCLPTKAS